MADIRAIIFDMDGVLVDARDWHYEALNRALALFGHTISRFDHLVTYDGLPTRRKLEMLTLERGLPAALHPFINELKQKYTMEIVHARCLPVFAHEFALSRLRARGYRLALASNSIRATVDLVLERTRLAQHMEFSLSALDVERAKPHPDIYLVAARRLGLRPDQCLVVEDNANGIRAARDAGAHVMEVGGVEDVHLDAILAGIERLGGGEAP